MGIKHMIHSILKDRKVVLASASPRRKQIFDLLGIVALCLPAEIDEPITDQKPFVQAKTHAINKARSVAQRVDTNTLVVASDTVVALGKTILGKPENIEQARLYLQKLSGQTHYVYSAICLIWKNRLLCDYRRSKVTFAHISDKEIESYITTKEPMDKAGAYGIQGYGAQFIDHISGCYFNIMGFPVSLFYKMIKEMFHADQD